MKNNRDTILVVNSGSSSLKLCLFSPNEIIRSQQNENINFETVFKPYSSVPLTAIGHRVVHGGAKYSTSVWIDKDVIKEIEEMSSLSPLHNIPSLNAIQFCSKMFPQVPQYAVFDTSFHRKMPEKARIYAIPYALSKKYSIERFGFHGIAHASSYNIYEKSFGPGKVINCHLGSGCSLAAIEKGISKDTSMGFTPNEGIMMATRSGDVDPGLFEFFYRRVGYSIEKIQEILNFESGLLGVSGISSSMKDVLKSPSDQAQLAVDHFCYRIQKTIGAYIAVLQGVDAILFSGGIGENASLVRKKILSPLDWLGVEVDDSRNNEAVQPEVSKIMEITRSSSKVKSYVIGNDESTYIFDQYLSLN
jgi:acetate kinase